MEHLSANDVSSLLAVFAAASNPTVVMPVATRQRELLTRFRELVAADAWLCFAGEVKDLLTGEWNSSSWMYDGFGDDVDPTEVFQCTCQPAIRAAFDSAETPESVEDRCIVSRSLGENSNGVRAANHLTAIGCHRLDGRFRGVSFFRPDGRPCFTARDAELAQLLFEHACWLHARPFQHSDDGELSPLSPRELEVTQLLLTGKSRKEVARQLRISAHTVTGYLKQIYTKLDVSSRAELLAKFIPINRDFADGDD